MFNPFELYGPQFLGFYTALLLASAVLVYMFWLTLGDRSKSRRPLTDPYMIAYLRGGAKEAVKIAAASLAHRKVISAVGDTISVKQLPSTLPHNELERVVLAACSPYTSFAQLAEGAPAVTAKNLFHDNLVRERLLLNPTEQGSLRVLNIAIIAVLAGVAAIKINFALQRGRFNVWFLIILAALGIFLHLKNDLWTTPKGSTALKDLRTLFSRLKERARQLAATTENHNFTFLIAVFGLAALSTHDYAFLTAFKPKRGSNAGCGSSCSSHACGSSGCGGGGCGSGCGGCGS